jgi:hypothetical protein
MSHALNAGDFLLLPDTKGFIRMSKEDVVALLDFAGTEAAEAASEKSGTEQNIDLLFATIHDMKRELGELQLQVQKLETGSRDDEREGPGPSERAFAARHEGAPTPMSERVVGPGDNDYGRKMTMNPALGAPYGVGQLPLTCTQLTATWADGGWRTPAAIIDTPLNIPAADGWCSFTWPNRASVRVTRGRLHARVGDKVVDLNPASGPVYIPSIQRFLLEPLTAECELCVDWTHATAPAQIPRDREEVEATNAAAHRQRLANAIMAYIADRVVKADDAALKSYNTEGKTSKTMALDAEAELITDIHDALNRVIQETKP